MIYPDTFLIYNGTAADSPRHFTREFGLCLEFEAGSLEIAFFTRFLYFFPTAASGQTVFDLHQNLNKKTAGKLD